MKYKIINTDLFINGKLFPEGEIISLDSPDESIIKYLELIVNQSPTTNHQQPITDDSSLITDNQQLLTDNPLPITDNLALSVVEGTNNKIKRSRKKTSNPLRIVEDEASVSPFNSHGDKK